MVTSVVPVDEMYPLVLDVNEHFSGRKVHFFGIDYSGERETERFMEAFNIYATPSFEFTISNVGMENGRDGKFNEFRPLNGLEKYNGSGDTTDFVAIENTALNTGNHTGRSAISGPIGIAYGMHNGIIPGKGYATIYLMTTEGDTIGVSNFAAAQDFKKFVGVTGHMKKIAPKTYMDLKKIDMIKQLSKHKPEFHSPYNEDVPDTHYTVQRIVKLSRALLL